MRNREKKVNMAPSAAKLKSVVEEVLDDFGNIIDRAAETMTDEEFRKAEKKARELARRPAASASRRRETA